jgi:hypothetical protein
VGFCWLLCSLFTFDQSYLGLLIANLILFGLTTAKPILFGLLMPTQSYSGLATPKPILFGLLTPTQSYSGLTTAKPVLFLFAGRQTTISMNKFYCFSIKHRSSVDRVIGISYLDFNPSSALLVHFPV